MEKKIKFWVNLWIVGMSGGIIFLLFVAIGRIKIRGWKNIKSASTRRGKLIVSNHPSLCEPVVLPFLLLSEALSGRVPISVADKINYYQKQWFAPIRIFCLPIERGNSKEELKAVGEMIGLLERGETLILYPESGRTFKGKDFKVSLSGKRIRRFPHGIRKLFTETEAVIVPVWTEGRENIFPNQLSFPRFPCIPFPRLGRSMTIASGEPIQLESAGGKNNGASKNEIVEKIEDILLSLGDSAR